MDADVFIGLSGQKDSLDANDVRTMADKPIVFATSNPDPEIHPDEAKKGGAFIVATGRSDFPNQLNNVLVFPGIFRGALDARVREITDAHKLKAAYALSAYIQEPSVDMILPSPLDKGVVAVVAGVFA